MTVDNTYQQARTSGSAFIAFAPFGAFLVYLFHQSMPLKWVSLAFLLKSVCLFTIYLNATMYDFLWIIFGVWAFLAVCIPVYMNVINTLSPKHTEKLYDKISLANLLKICSNAVFSDFRLALLAKIPLVAQVLAGGSILYAISGADWIMHAVAGFGIGAMALKAYKKAVSHYGYIHLASYFHLDRFQVFATERKTGSAEFTLFSLTSVALTWEIFERLVYFASPTNVFRIRAEPFWNVVGDMLFAITGGMLAWYLVNCKVKWV